MRQQVAQPGSKENVARTQMRQPQPAVHKPQPRGVTAELLNLQRTHGNRFVQQLLNGGMLQRKCACGGGCPRCQKASLLQTKLKINEPGDRYEQEADLIAVVLHGCRTAAGDDSFAEALLKAILGTSPKARVYGHSESGTCGRDKNWREFSKKYIEGKRRKKLP